MSSSDNVFTGCMPALMTPCSADGTVDFDALVRKGQEMIDAGMSAVDDRAHAGVDHCWSARDKK